MFINRNTPAAIGYWMRYLANLFFNLWSSATFGNSSVLPADSPLRWFQDQHVMDRLLASRMILHLFFMSAPVMDAPRHLKMFQFMFSDVHFCVSSVWLVQQHRFHVFFTVSTLFRNLVELKPIVVCVNGPGTLPSVIRVQSLQSSFFKPPDLTSQLCPTCHSVFLL